MPNTKRLLHALAACGLAGALFVPAATASTSQVAMIEDNSALYSAPQQTVTLMRSIGVSDVKVVVFWNDTAPTPNATHAPAGFVATNPADYPASNWAPLDTIVRDATAAGLTVTLEPTAPAPRWAWGPHPQTTSGTWEPSASDYKAFVEALGTRYSGHYAPAGQSALPAVRSWSVWNEPNYGQDLAPQGIDHNTVFEGAIMYRGLVNAAWQGLHATGHAGNRFLIGETAPRGVAGRGLPGNGGGLKPLQFLATLYCATTTGHRLTGAAARANGCAVSASAFRAANPGLFQASGYAQHPYAQGDAPTIPTYACTIGGRATFCWNSRTKKSDPYYADFAELPRLERTLDTLQRLYGSHKQYSIYNTEFGYWTNPPDTARGSLPVSTAAYYMNWAEYLSYENPRIASYDQYELYDPANGDFADGLLSANGTPRATLAAYEVPLYLPTTSSSHPTSLVVWGGVRPAAYAQSAAGASQTAQIQFAPTHGAFSTVRTVTITNSRGYFAVRVPFSRSGTVRIVWTNPLSGQTVTSRTQTISVR